MTRLVIVGAGGFGREVFAIVAALVEHGADWDVIGFVDDGASDLDRERVADLGSTILGSVADLENWTTDYAAVIAVGSPTARESICQRLDGGPVAFPALVHPHATVGLHVNLAEGAVIAPGARLSTNIAVGRHVHIDQNACVGHDSVLEDFSRLNPQACISGSVTVGRGATVGASATVLQGLSVGQGSQVGAGAVVTHDVGAHKTVKGVPAR